MRNNKDNNSVKKAKLFISSSLIGLVIAVWCCQLVAYPMASRINVPGLDQKVLKLALTAYQNAKNAGHINNDYLTVVDYSLPSTTKRMWVINMQNKKVVHYTHVAHGKGTGDNYARNFSNIHGTRMSSLGSFVTGDMYNGQHGTSLRLHGLDGKFNSNALGRGIVIHKANYVDEHVINQIGRLGRSFGCLALNNKIADQVMHTIKHGSLIFCYYPDQTWLRESAMLH